MKMALTTRAHARPGNFIRKILPVSLALSLSVGQALQAMAGPGDVNSINDGQNIQSGTYFNTQGSKTTFKNSSGGGLHLRSGDLVRGLESDISGTPNGHGGTLHFLAPNSVIRIDGTIDASAVKSGNLYLGNGGKVFLDAAYLFQSGSIFANGFNGGLVQMNVGAATLTPEARISAQGFGGNGGVISINSPGQIDIQRGAVLDSSGKVLGTFNTNVINIEGGLVNMEGILRANGVARNDLKVADTALVSANPNLLNNPQPGTITAGTGQGVIMGAPVPHQVPEAPSERGGTVRLVALGQTMSVASDIAGSAVLTSGEKTTIANRQNSLASLDGDVRNMNQIEARGGTGEDGGTIMLAAKDDVMNFGFLNVNGGNGRTLPNGNGTDAGDGGTILLAAQDEIKNHGFIEAVGGNGGNAGNANLNTGTGQPSTIEATATPGTGGKGGMIAFSYATMENRGKIIADGGAGGFGGNANLLHSEVAVGNENIVSRGTAIGGDGGTGGRGGLIVFSGPDNPTGGGLVQANGGRGGRGGNAVVDVRASTRGTGALSFETNPIRGAGGQGAPVGTVVAPNPGDFIGDQNYLSQAGGVGNSGTQHHIRVATRNGVNTVSAQFDSAIAGSRTTGPHNTIQATRRNELLVNKENAFLISRAGGIGTTLGTFSGRLNAAIVRRVDSPLGSGEVGLNAAQLAGNLAVVANDNTALDFDFDNNNTEPIFTNLHTLTVLNNGSITNGMHWSPGVHQVGGGFHDTEFALGGGHTSMLTNGDFANDGFLLSRGLWSGGSNNVAASGNLTNNGVIMNVAFNKHLATGYTRTAGYDSSHAGSTVLKAGGNLTNNYRINHNQAFFDIHPGLAGGNPAFVRFLNGANMGASNFAQAGGNITNSTGALWSADARTYRELDADNGQNNPALSQAGMIVMKAGGTITNNGSITANAEAFNGTVDDRFSTMTGVNPTIGFDGTIDLENNVTP